MFLFFNFHKNALKDKYIYSDSIQMAIMYFNHLSISGHIFTNRMFIFHKNWGSNNHFDVLNGSES